MKRDSREFPAVRGGSLQFCRRHAISAFFVLAAVLAGEPVFAQLEEIIVTARKREESLQDVPIAVSAVSGDTIEKFDFDNIREIGRRVPQLQIHSGGSGQGGAIWFRGIGAQSGSGAFDSSVAFNIDGSVLNSPRILQNSFFDIQGFELLRGPQPTYFGKSATAGVVSLRTKNPTEKFEASIAASYDFETESTALEGIISGPLSETFGARFAVRDKSTDKQFVNIAPNVANPNRGEESTDARLTLDWQATDAFNLNLKYSTFAYENDGQLQYFRLQQVGDVVNSSGAQSPPPGQTFNPDPSFFAGTTSTYFRDGVPYQETDTTHGRLQATWDLQEAMTITAILSKIDIESEAMDNFTFRPGAPGINAPRDELDIATAEIRLQGDIGDRVRYTVGGYYEDHTQLFDTEQFIGLAGLGATGGVPALPDGAGGFIPVSGATYTPVFASTSDYVGAIFDTRKIHSTDSEVTSIFASVEFDITDRLTASIGGRYTDVSREGTITVPFVSDFIIDLASVTDVVDVTDPDGSVVTRTVLPYAAAIAAGLQNNPFPNTPLGLLSPVYVGTPFENFTSAQLVAGIFGGACDTRLGPCVTPVLNFEDSDTNVEVILDYAIDDNQSIFVAYKEAFKPGGIDNSITAWNDDIVTLSNDSAGDVLFESETVDGFEIGYKSVLADQQLRLNALLYNYTYEDFQVQTFQNSTFQFRTGNAGKVTSRGLEVDFDYAPANIEQLDIYGAFSFDDSEYDQFITPEDANDLSGRRLGLNPEFAANLGFTYEIPLSASLDLTLGYNFRYSGKYFTENLRPEGDEYVQDAYSIHDLVLSLAPGDRDWSVTLSAVNIGDEIFTVYSTDAVGQGSVPLAERDKGVRESAGRLLTLRLKYNF